MADRRIRIEELASLVSKRRQKLGLGLRDAAEEAGVSFNTLGRVERGHVPNLDAFQRIVAWLGLDPGRFFSVSQRYHETTPEVIAHHLRHDNRLSEEAAETIAGIVSDLYSSLVKHDSVAVHLRAATTFKPKAADMLAAILRDMQAALQAEPQD